jgi:putative acetyltransferase
VKTAGTTTVELVRSAMDDVRILVTELDQIFSAEYPPEQRHGLALDEIFEPNIRFFLARVSGEAVGCGGVALFADFAEVKRMYVCDAVRGHGVAQALLARIEKEARDAGLALLRLETGTRQVAALRFYQRAGFRSCAAFGAYATMPPDAVATSVFLQKQLAPPTHRDIRSVASAPDPHGR